MSPAIVVVPAVIVVIPMFYVLTRFARIKFFSSLNCTRAFACQIFIRKKPPRSATCSDIWLLNFTENFLVFLCFQDWSRIFDPNKNKILDARSNSYHSEGAICTYIHMWMWVKRRERIRTKRFSRLFEFSQNSIKPKAQNLIKVSFKVFFFFFQFNLIVTYTYTSYTVYLWKRQWNQREKFRTHSIRKRKKY